MSTTNLDPQLLQEIVNLLVPHMTTDADRQAILRLALRDKVSRRIDFHGSPHVFTMNMVNALLEFGEIEPGKQAIIALLNVIKDQVGVDKQRQIDRLQDELRKHFKKYKYDVISCPICGTDNRKGARFCRNCSIALATLPGPLMSPPPKIFSAGLTQDGNPGTPPEMAAGRQDAAVPGILRKSYSERKRQHLRYTLSLLLILFSAIVIWQLWPAGYTITISNPTDSITCPDKSRCQFAVEGAISKKVVNDPALDIYVFVSPLNAGNWYLQVTPAAIDPKGTWRQTPSQIGNQDEPVAAGDTFQIVALVLPKDATIEGRKLSEWTPGQPIRSYRDIEHLAVSNLVVLHVN